MKFDFFLIFKARRCPHCDKVYVSVPAFSMHVRTHSQGCKCPYCGKSFSRPWLLQGHIRTHTGTVFEKWNLFEFSMDLILILTVYNNRREAVHLPNLRESFRRQIQSARPHPDSFQFEAVHVPTMWQSLRSQILSLQARRVIVHENGHQNFCWSQRRLEKQPVSQSNIEPIIYYTYTI